MNLKTEQGRKAAIEEIETSFINSLREIGVELSEDVLCRIRESIIDIGIYDEDKDLKKEKIFAFSSSVELYPKQEDDYIFGSKPNCINLCASGSFDNTQRESYWRTIHAASILKNWEKVCKSVNQHCQRYSDLVNEINKQNP